MKINLLKSKIHDATVTEANLHYVGSITIDGNLLDRCGMLEYEKVLIVNKSNTARIETYIFRGVPGSGVICLNGPSARLFVPGDKIIIMAFCQMKPKAAKTHKPVVVLVDKNNKLSRIKRGEKSED